MTREEEIKQAAESNLDVSAYTPQDGKMLKETFYIGAEWADKNPKCPWINVKDDLPCNHEELINDDSCFGRFTKRVFAYHEDNRLYDDDYMYEFNGEWKWGSCRNTKYWFPIPELPKE